MLVEMVPFVLYAAPVVCLAVVGGGMFFIGKLIGWCLMGDEARFG